MELLKINGQKYFRREIASFDVDPQRGFSPLCPDELPVDGAIEIVSELNLQANFAGKRIFSKDAHSQNAKWVASKEQPQLSPIKGEANLDIRWNRHCEVGTDGFELLPGLPDEAEYDFFVYKGAEKDLHPYGACYHDLSDKISTGVIEYLKFHKIQVVIVGGLALDFCVYKTVSQLLAAGFIIILNLGACRGIDSLSTQSAMNDMAHNGAIIVENAAEIDSRFFIPM